MSRREGRVTLGDQVGRAQGGWGRAMVCLCAPWTVWEGKRWARASAAPFSHSLVTFSYSPPLCFFIHSQPGLGFLRLRPAQLCRSLAEQVLV